VGKDGVTAGVEHRRQRSIDRRKPGARGREDNLVSGAHWRNVYMGSHWRSKAA